MGFFKEGWCTTILGIFLIYSQNVSFQICDHCICTFTNVSSCPYGYIGYSQSRPTLSFCIMQGFSINTYTLLNVKGEQHSVKFHLIPGKILVCFQETLLCTFHLHLFRLLW